MTNFHYFQIVVCTAAMGGFIFACRKEHAKEGRFTPLAALYALCGIVFGSLVFWKPDVPFQVAFGMDQLKTLIWSSAALCLTLYAISAFRKAKRIDRQTAVFAIGAVGAFILIFWRF